MAEYPEIRFIKESKRACGWWQLRDYFSLFNLKKMLRYPNLRKQKTNFRTLLNKAVREGQKQAGFTMFLTDDSVFIKPVSLTSEDLYFISRNPNLNQITLRLGRDVTEKPVEIESNNGKFFWNFHRFRHSRSWGYNFSVDAHIYSTKVLERVLGKVIFNNPNTLEANVVHYVREHNIFDSGMTYEEPYILSFPLNVVQTVSNNESLGVSVEKLNTLFLAGNRLDYIIPEKILEFQQYPSEVIILNGKNEETLKLS